MQIIIWLFDVMQWHSSVSLSLAISLVGGNYFSYDILDVMSRVTIRD
ncbi:MAG: hypothetical protein HY755_12880 [Nitrospirae bacterium]|nr:hypothetical protein [Nitrospirota bacterium]